MMRRFTRDVLVSALGALAPLLVVPVLTLLTAIAFRDSLTTTIVSIFAIWLLCVYVVVRRQRPRISRTPSARAHPGPFRFPRLRPWATGGLIALPIVSSLVWIVFQAHQPQSILILVAEFSGPDPEKYQVTNAVYESLTQAASEANNLRVELVGRSFADSDSARMEGERRGATALIWGWYGNPGEVVPLSVHYEVMGELETLAKYCPAARGEIRLVPASELESFILQTNLSGELAYLGLFTLGLSHIHRAEWSLAVSAFDGAIQAAPANVPSWPITNTYYYRGRANIELGSYGAAVADMSQAIASWPDAPAPYFHRAHAGAATGDLRAAIRDYSEVIKLDSSNLNAIKFRGDAFFSVGDYPSAISDYSDLIIQDPGVFCTLVDRGYANLENGNYDEATSDFQSALQRAPGLPEATYGLARVDFAQHRYPEAIDLLSTAIEVSDRAGFDFPAAYLYRGYARLAIGEPESALDDFRKVIAILDASSRPHVSYLLPNFEGIIRADAQEQIEMLTAE